MVGARERATLDGAVKMAKRVHSWEARVFDEVFASNPLAHPVAQEAARKPPQMGVSDESADGADTAAYCNCSAGAQSGATSDCELLLVGVVMSCTSSSSSRRKSGAHPRG
ncbi:hypothetical protein KRP22_012194 [Phytophthora ramorum]|uniref:uncharacterized protein n=1 Tax=Phytophthora ramorum TaxID=164328 RepID=UPI0030AFB9B5|nr:hypothetical protein KRP23_2933 [Phytophthora ramorum]KAH7495287.1 hypothetical protein KRP22_14898 [Phytophthora ramorum]